jgi:hypothetical protein
VLVNENPEQPAFDATTMLTTSAWVLSTSYDGVGPFGILSKRTDYEVMPKYATFVGSGNAAFACSPPTR